ncbi:MAG: hypothetical protein MPEBLZ_00214 [Candidatus Methanoperedens nitroreducens]|uniref:Uncharacterized protein n=1 Tax=Candidatus Methanoperedens nitratireducens TaxID=1392998 RepID=A0A0P8E3Q4_9EURY|nr:MAG: hypothetical protein MPEBLZ_00214 [Candidatus Methanoperedens sp. BLZ1]
MNSTITSIGFKENARKVSTVKMAIKRYLAREESVLKSGIMNDGEFEESIEGTPQGGNIRYADDIVIFCKFESDAQDALIRAKEMLPFQWTL